MSEKRKPDPKERVAQVTRRPGKLAQSRSTSKFLHRVRVEHRESQKLKEAMSRTPVFKQAAWARLVGSTLTALHRLLGTGKRPSAPPTKARRSLPKPVTTEKMAKARAMLSRMLTFLQEVAEHRMAAQVARDADGKLRANLSEEERNALDKQREGLNHEQDVVIYPSQVFYKDDPITRLRR